MPKIFKLTFDGDAVEFWTANDEAEVRSAADREYILAPSEHAELVIEEVPAELAAKIIIQPKDTFHFEAASLAVLAEIAGNCSWVASLEKYERKEGE